ncbi:hypothetical protein [Brotaphodocola sp.]|uniref:hypothetical protein n=1 Tax=Brotaphodocola sp. TaxID=3073577 RepID=UPI003D7E8577
MDGENEAVAVDEVVLSDKNRLVILDFGGGTDEEGLEEAVRAFIYPDHPLLP